MGSGEGGDDADVRGDQAVPRVEHVFVLVGFLFDRLDDDSLRRACRHSYQARGGLIPRVHIVLKRASRGATMRSARFKRVAAVSAAGIAFVSGGVMAITSTTVAKREM